MGLSDLEYYGAFSNARLTFPTFQKRREFLERRPGNSACDREREVGQALQRGVRTGDQAVWQRRVRLRRSRRQEARPGRVLRDGMERRLAKILSRELPASRSNAASARTGRRALHLGRIEGQQAPHRGGTGRLHPVREAWLARRFYPADPAQGSACRARQRGLHEAPRSGCRQGIFDSRLLLLSRTH